MSQVVVIDVDSDGSSQLSIDDLELSTVIEASFEDRAWAPRQETPKQEASAPASIEYTDASPSKKIRRETSVKPEDSQPELNTNAEPLHVFAAMNATHDR